MKNQILIIFIFISAYSLKAQSLALLNSGNISIESSHHEYSKNVVKLSGTEFYLKNTTNLTISYGVKAYWISSSGSLGGMDNVQVCVGSSCQVVNDSILETQFVNDPDANISACGFDNNVKIAPFAFGAKVGDETVWRITIYDVLNPNDSVSSIITWKYVIAGDVNEDGVIGAGEIAGDLDNSGIIEGNEFAGDVDGDGLRLHNIEFFGDLNGNGIIDAGEVRGDNNANGTISGDANSDKMIGVGEIVGDMDNGGTIGTGEVAGDNSGDGLILGGEMAGDINGNGFIETGEICGDNSGNGVIEGSELAGDRNGDGMINNDEFLGDISGNGSLTNGELPGDLNGNLLIDGLEIANDFDNDGFGRGCELSITSINELSLSDINFKVYPNPVTDRLNIDYKFDGNVFSAIINVYDVLGNWINSHAVNTLGETSVIDVSEMDTGIYFFVLRVNGTNTVLKTERIIVD